MPTNSFQRQFSRFYSQELKKSFDATSGDSFLLFFGRTVPWGSTFAGDPTTGTDISPPGNANSLGERNDAWRNAIGGKLLEPRDVYHVFKRIDWVHNTVYKPYADNVDIHDGTYNFYVLTDENNVYKCLDNNSGSPSTTKPTGTSTSIFTTAEDNYVWKFIFKVTEDSRKFLNLEYIPCKYVTEREENETLSQYNVQTSAIDGSIDFLGLTGTNATYWNFVTQADDVACEVISPNPSDVGPNGHLKEVDNQVELDDFNGMNDFWVKVAYPSNHNPADDLDWSANEGYAMYIHSGLGPEVGQLRKIVNHVAGDNGALLKLDAPLGAALNVGVNASKYVISPHIVINGDGENATARTTCGLDGKITKATIVNRGEKYRNASVSFITDSQGESVPTIVPHISPVGGHGANPIVDFNASQVMINVKMDGEEGGDFLIGDDIRQYGLIKNPTISGGGKSGGGEYTGDVAGTEFSKTKYLNIIPTHVNTTPFDYDTDSPNVTFKAGDYAMGSESRATARIKSWRKKVGSGVEGDQGILEVDKISSKFDVPVAQTHEVRYVFSGDPVEGEESNVVSGYPIQQFANGISTDASAKGIVTGYSREDNELTVQLKSGSIGRTGDLYVNYSHATKEVKFLDSQITLFENKGGELFKSYSVAGNGDITFREYGTTQDCARARNITEIVSLYDRIPTYNLTHKLTIRDDDAGLEIGTFSAGQNIRQERTNGTITSATVSKWTKVASGDGTTGEMIVSNVLNKFEDVANDENGLFSVLDETTGENKTITDIQIPELNVGSGEVLYIQNIRPITRSFEQQEEFKIVLGF